MHFEKHATILVSDEPPEELERREISHHREVAHGSAFANYAPQLSVFAEEIAATSTESEMLRGAETVLLVEDEEVVRKITQEFLLMSGYHVLEAQHGGEALSISEQYAQPIHLLLTDVMMPEMSGRELANRLKRRRPEMQVLYMSGYTNEAIAHLGVLDNGVAFMQKPFTLDSLLFKMRGVLCATPSERVAD